MVKLDLQTFSGRNALDFLPWFQAFKASVWDTKLPDVQKIIYLHHYCTGPARAAIEQFQLTEENLQPAIQTLKERFNRPDQVLNGTFNKISRWSDAQKEMYLVKATQICPKLKVLDFRKLSKHSTIQCILYNQENHSSHLVTWYVKSFLFLEAYHTEDGF